MGSIPDRALTTENHFTCYFQNAIKDAMLPRKLQTLRLLGYKISDICLEIKPSRNFRVMKGCKMRNFHDNLTIEYSALFFKVGYV